jgi:TonB-linked SusC/RagA family outer membrane protein
MMFSAGVMLAQEKTVSGTVTADDGTGSLPGVNIFIQGTTVGTISDLDGAYQLTVSGPDDVLIFSSVGYVTQSITVGSQSVIDVVMEADVTALQEVVVTGYTAQSRRNISGAVATVSPDEIRQMPIANIGQAMHGRAPGLITSTSGEPGTPVQLRIRGYGSINNNNPLYILDGTPVSSWDIQQVNPMDIESIQVLKEASTASIYGARAANGVVIITTIKGSKKDKSEITLDLSYGVQIPSNLPTPLGPQELADVIYAAQDNAGIPPSHPQYGTGTFTLPNYLIPTGASSADESAYDFETNAITQSNPSGTDWMDEVFQTAPVQQYNLTARGGNSKGQYAVSLGYYDQDGVVIHTPYKRLSMRVNSDFNVKERVRIGETLMVTWEDRQSISGGRQGTGNTVQMAMRMPSIIPVRDIGGNYAGTRASGFNNPENPVAYQEIGKDNINQRMRLLGSVFAEVDFLKHLTFKTSFNYNFSMSFEEQTFDYPQIWNAEPAVTEALSTNRDNYFNWTWYNTLNYVQTFGNAHNLGVLLGTEAIENYGTGLGGSRSQYFSRSLDYRVLNAGETGFNNYGWRDEWSLFSLFGKVDYDYNGKYIVSFTVRRDGASRFGEGNRYGVFPAASAAWRISDEGFMQGIGAIDDLKLRVGWGQTGNQNIGNYTWASTFGPSIDYSAYGIAGGQNTVVTGFDRQRIGNPDVVWETTTTLDIGFDLTMLSNRLTVEFDWYDRKTEDMLIQVPVSTLAGIATNPFRNVGEMSNTGVDIGIMWQSNSTGDFNWGIGANLTIYKNEVTKLYNEDQFFFSGGYRTFNATRTEQGEPIGTFFGYNILGVFMTDEEVQNHAEQAGAAVGRWKYEDVDGSGTITAEDRKILGSPHPDLIFGIPVNFSWRNFDLNLFFNGTYGNELFNTTYYFNHFVQIFQNSGKTDEVLQSWGYNGQNERPDAYLPQINQNAPAIEVNPSSHNVEDGSFLRLQQLTLAYNVPQSALQKVGIDRLRVFFQGMNLLTFTNYRGIDPEISTVANPNESGSDLAVGVDIAQYPVVKTVQLGLNLTF